MSLFLVLVFALVVSLFTGLTLCALVPVLQTRFLDQPNSRSSHSLPTPRGGGLAFVLVGSFSVAFLGCWLLLLGLPLALVGFLDDRCSMPAALRYGVHFATAFILVFISPLQFFSIGILPCLFLLFACTAIVNFTNFMDGMDGLVAGCMAVLFAVASLTGMSYLWPLVGALLGFLPWNWSPAKVFMGDVGSTFLGFVFAGVLLQQTSFQAAFALLLVATPLLADACVCVIRRLLAGQNVFQAHRLHLFQRLHQAGWTHASVASLYIFATTILGAALLAGGLLWVIFFVLVVMSIGFWLDLQVAVPFSAA